MNEEINKQNNKGSIKKGILYVVFGHIIYGVCCLLFYLSADLGLRKRDYYDLVPMILFCFIWLIQFIYIIPMAIYFKKQKQTLKGILIISGITFLLGGGICGAMMLPHILR